VLSWDASCTQHTLQLRDVQPENGNHQSERDGWEEIEVLSCLVECWWMLEDAQAARSYSHEVEPLPGSVMLVDIYMMDQKGEVLIHDNKVDEVDTGCFIES
jgi:hypothetical protein